MVVTVAVPGRIELLGNHTDYNGGRVLVAPAQGVVRVSLTAVSTPGLVVRSTAFPIPFRQSGGAIRRVRGASAWANHALGALRLGLERWPRRGGLHVAIRGNLPVGAGLSSSAALSVAILRGLARLAGQRESVALVAALAQRVETDFVGVPVGPLDPLSCATARRGWLTLLDFAAEPRVRRVRLPPGWEVLLFDSGARRRLQSSAYASRRAECAAAARALGVEKLGCLSVGQWSRRAGLLSDPLRRRARHVVGESARVDEAFGILQRGGEPAKIGALLNASMRSSRENFENSHPAIDAVVARLRKIHGVAGARLTGGGFGGTVIAWVRSADADRITMQMTAPGPGSARRLKAA